MQWFVLITSVAYFHTSNSRYAATQNGLVSIDEIQAEKDDFFSTNFLCFSSTSNYVQPFLSPTIQSSKITAARETIRTGSVLCIAGNAHTEGHQLHMCGADDGSSFISASPPDGLVDPKSSYVTICLSESASVAGVGHTRGSRRDDDARRGVGVGAPAARKTACADQGRRASVASRDRG
jgi:hypothetical protein